MHTIKNVTKDHAIISAQGFKVGEVQWQHLFG